MTINNRIITELEHTHREFFPDDLKRYLLVKYAQEPFPYEFSEQDLYTNIENDIRAYGAGELDVSMKSPSEYWQEARNYLQSLYVEKCQETRELEEYIAKLERILNENNLKSPMMADHLINY